MQTPVLISILTNIVLTIALIYVGFGKKVYKYITEHKKRRERQAYEERTKEIRKIVIEYLEEIRKDG